MLINEIKYICINMETRGEALDCTVDYEASEIIVCAFLKKYHCTKNEVFH